MSSRSVRRTGRPYTDSDAPRRPPQGRRRWAFWTEHHRTSRIKLMEVRPRVVRRSRVGYILVPPFPRERHARAQDDSHHRGHRRDRGCRRWVPPTPLTPAHGGRPQDEGGHPGGRMWGPGDRAPHSSAESLGYSVRRGSGPVSPSRSGPAVKPLPVSTSASEAAAVSVSGVSTSGSRRSACCSCSSTS